jgi:DNA polymerase III epsilon subunit-like protein
MLNKECNYNEIKMIANRKDESFISVDVETAGPNPSQFSLLSIGACVVWQPRETFYVELQPVNDEILPETLAIHGLNIASLKEAGLPPSQGMNRFEAWLKQVVPQGKSPVFVAFNAPFDWMFVNDYFHRYLGRNPFGHSALDIKAFYMGLTGCAWQDTVMQKVAAEVFDSRQISHNARQDAIDQAEIFTRLLNRNS